MNIRSLVQLALCTIVLSSVPSFAQTKVAIVNMEEAISRTQEGQALMLEFQQKLFLKILLSYLLGYAQYL